MQASPQTWGKDDLDLLDDADIDKLFEDDASSSSGDVELSDIEEVDDLESLKDDIGDSLFEEPVKEKTKIVKKKPKEKPKDKKGTPSVVERPIESKQADPQSMDTVNDKLFIDSSQYKTSDHKEKVEVFDIGTEEKKLLEMSKYVESKISGKEWSEISSATKDEQYTVQEGDTLWSICGRLFGSGFYYSKIWSLNPQITNPHEIEPGLTLLFSSGDEDTFPQVALGEFKKNEDVVEGAPVLANEKKFQFDRFGEGTVPNWLNERKELISQGVYFQFASDETYEDLAKLGKEALTTEHQAYEPPLTEIIIKEPGEQYDNSGFDKNSKITFNVKEGFFLNTFMTSNIIQDLGYITNMAKENVFIHQFDKIYVNFDSSVNVKPGDLFSVYIPGGPTKNKASDRSGHKYTIGAQIKVLRQINKKWECLVTEQSGVIQRDDRVTLYTPKIQKIKPTFNKRNIEAIIMDSYDQRSNGLSFGDVVYLDRGRADGVELGTIFTLHDYQDRGTGRQITADPTYKIGEVTVISLSDNFATGLISNSSQEIKIGTIAITKTEEEAALSDRIRTRKDLQNVYAKESQSLEELDVELNLDDLSKDLLEKADRVQLTEDELEELERQEREKSVIKDHEKDLNELERLEDEILEAETQINEHKVDEDKYLEQENLNAVEKKVKGQDKDAFESLNEIEKDIGLKYMDEDINAKENPYGLTEFDLEEIDELLNTEQL